MKSGKMKRLKARIRGVIGLGVIGALVGFVAGALWGLASSVVRSGVSLDPDYLRFLWSMSFGNAVGFMKIGGFTSAGFGLLLTAADSRRFLDDLRLWRMGLFGGLVGASFPPIYVIGRMGFTAYWDAASSFLLVMGVLGVIGGVLTTSMVAMAKRANRNELAASRGSSGALAEVSEQEVE